MTRVNLTVDLTKPQTCPPASEGCKRTDLHYSGRLLNIDNNAKTVKGQKQGYMTAILYLAPVDLSGYQVCPMASLGCKAACLNTAGQGAFSNVQQARITKTRFFFEHREAFMRQLAIELGKFVVKAERLGFTPVVRLNGTSDILWERVPVNGAPNIMALFPDVQFYDYTKHSPAKRTDLPANYVLTFSLDERPESEVRAVEAIRRGWNVAVVFRGELPYIFRIGDYYGPASMTGLGPVHVVDGDQNDLRFLDGHGVIVGLKAKGKARHDTSGFVR